MSKVAVSSEKSRFSFLAVPLFLTEEVSSPEWGSSRGLVSRIMNHTIIFCNRLYIFPRMKPDLDPLADSCDCKGAAAHKMSILFGNNAK